MIIAIIALLIGMLLPAVQKVRGAAARTQCQNNLKQIMIAMHSHHDATKGFPYLYKAYAGSSGIAYTSYAIPILPYMEQDALYREIQNRSPSPVWYGLGGNMPDATSEIGLATTTVRTYLCPTDDINPPVAGSTYSNPPRNYAATMSYKGCVGSGSAYTYDGFVRPSGYQIPPPMRIETITDGTSSTIAMGEWTSYEPNWSQNIVFGTTSLDGAIARPLKRVGNAWVGVNGLSGSDPTDHGGYAGNPLNYRLPTGSSNSFNAITRILAFGSQHPGGANFGFCDGSVRFVRNEVSETMVGNVTLLGALATTAGGEVTSGDF